jgi:hypothetical protein
VREARKKSAREPTTPECIDLTVRRMPGPPHPLKHGQVPTDVVMVLSNEGEVAL